MLESRTELLRIMLNNPNPCDECEYDAMYLKTLKRHKLAQTEKFHDTYNDAEHKKLDKNVRDQLNNIQDEESYKYVEFYYYLSDGAATLGKKAAKEQ